MAGTRRVNNQFQEIQKISILIPEDLLRRLRRHANSNGVKVGPLVREWIEAQLVSAEALAQQP